MIPVEGYAWARDVEVFPMPLKLWAFHPFHHGTRVPHPVKQVAPTKSENWRVSTGLILDPHWIPGALPTNYLWLRNSSPALKMPLGQISTSFIHKEDNTVFGDTKERNLSVQPTPWCTDKRWGIQNQPRQLTFDLENSSSLFSPITTSLCHVQFSCYAEWLYTTEIHTFNFQEKKIIFYNVE